MFALERKMPHSKISIVKIDVTRSICLARKAYDYLQAQPSFIMLASFLTLLLPGMLYSITVSLFLASGLEAPGLKLSLNCFFQILFASLNLLLLLGLFCGLSIMKKGKSVRIWCLFSCSQYWREAIYLALHNFILLTLITVILRSLILYLGYFDEVLDLTKVLFTGSSNEQIRFFVEQEFVSSGDELKSFISIFLRWSILGLLFMSIFGSVYLVSVYCGMLITQYKISFFQALALAYRAFYKNLAFTLIMIFCSVLGGGLYLLILGVIGIVTIGFSFLVGLILIVSLYYVLIYVSFQEVFSIDEIGSEEPDA